MWAQVLHSYDNRAGQIITALLAVNFSRPPLA
jgi:hypothetical protein